MIMHFDGVMVKVIDADTVDVLLDLGFDLSKKVRVRLAGIDAPERYTVEGKIAKKYLSTRLPKGTKIAVETVKVKEKYGRFVATLWTPETLRSINVELVEEGHAVTKEY